MIKVKIRPRRSGKTTELIDLARDLDMLDKRVWIFTDTINQQTWIKTTLQRLGYDPNNIQIFSVSEEPRLEGQRKPDYILVDNAEAITLGLLLEFGTWAPTKGWANSISPKHDKPIYERMGIQVE